MFLALRICLRRILAILAVWMILPGHAPAATTYCKYWYIQGVKESYDRALKVMGRGTVSDPRRMSVYVTAVTLDKGDRYVYLQSNFAPKGAKHAHKILTDATDLRFHVYALPNFARVSPFDLSGVTYYVEQAFLNDQVYGKLKDALVGKVCVLGADGRVGERYVQKEGPPESGLDWAVPEGWVKVARGKVLTPGATAPPSILQRSRDPKLDLVAFDPAGLKDDNAAVLFYEDDPTARSVVDEETLKGLGDVYAKGCACTVVESRVIDAFGYKILRIVQDRGAGQGRYELRSVIYFVQHGRKMAVITGTCKGSQFGTYGAVFQDALQKTFENSPGGAP